MFDCQVYPKPASTSMLDVTFRLEPVFQSVIVLVKTIQYEVLPSSKGPLVNANL
jgi:hypothetical protein